MNIDNIKRLIDFDTPTVANGLELLKLRDPSLGYTGPDVRALMPVTSPVLDAAPAHFETTMRAILADREAFATIAAEGPGYVAEVHSGRLSAEVLAEFVGVPTA